MFCHSNKLKHYKLCYKTIIEALPHDMNGFSQNHAASVWDLENTISSIHRHLTWVCRVGAIYWVLVDH